MEEKTKEELMRELELSNARVDELERRIKSMLGETRDLEKQVELWRNSYNETEKKLRRASSMLNGVKLVLVSYEE